MARVQGARHRLLPGAVAGDRPRARRGIRADYAATLPSAVACFEDDFEACIAHLRLPVTHRRATRTTNLLERLFVEERRRLKIIPNGFGEKPVLKLMLCGSALGLSPYARTRIPQPDPADNDDPLAAFARAGRTSLSER